MVRFDLDNEKDGFVEMDFNEKNFKLPDVPHIAAPGYASISMADLKRLQQYLDEMAELKSKINGILYDVFKGQSENLEEFDYVQKILETDLRLGLQKKHIINYDFNIQGTQYYTGSPVKYDPKINYLVIAREKFKEEGFGDLQGIYYQTAKFSMYRNLISWSYYALEHTPKHARTKCGLFTVRVDGVIAPWMMVYNFDSCDEARTEGMNFVARNLAENQNSRHRVSKNIERMKLLNRIGNQK